MSDDTRNEETTTAMTDNRRPREDRPGDTSGSSLAEAIEDHALGAVPPDRRQSLLQLIVVQVGWNVSISSFLVGGVVGAGVPFSAMKVGQSNFVMR